MSDYVNLGAHRMSDVGGMQRATTATRAVVEALAEITAAGATGEPAATARLRRGLAALAVEIRNGCGGEPRILDALRRLHAQGLTLIAELERRRN